MKIAIVSDSHDNLPNIDKMLAYCKQEKIETMLHCGDVCSEDVLKYLAQQFNGELYVVLGNVRGELDKMVAVSKEFPHLQYLGEEGEVDLAGLKIYLTHYPEVAKKMAETKKYNFVFYGHTHKPWEEKIGNCRVVNPGTLAGMFTKATFAVLDAETKNLELKLLELL